MELALFQKQEAWEEAAEVCVQIGRTNWDWMKRNFLKLFRTRMIPCPGHWGSLLLSCPQTNVLFHSLWYGKRACEDLMTYFCSLWKSTAQAWLYFLTCHFILPLGQDQHACSYLIAWDILQDQDHTAWQTASGHAGRIWGCDWGSHVEETLRAMLRALGPDPLLIPLQEQRLPRVTLAPWLTFNHSTVNGPEVTFSTINR